MGQGSSADLWHAHGKTPYFSLPPQPSYPTKKHTLSFCHHFMLHPLYSVIHVPPVIWYRNISYFLCLSLCTLDIASYKTWQLYLQSNITPLWLLLLTLELEQAALLSLLTAMKLQPSNHERKREWWGRTKAQREKKMRVKIRNRLRSVYWQSSYLKLRAANKRGIAGMVSFLPMCLMIICWHLEDKKGKDIELRNKYQWEKSVSVEIYYSFSLNNTNV